MRHSISSTLRLHPTCTLLLLEVTLNPSNKLHLFNTFHHNPSIQVLYVLSPGEPAPATPSSIIPVSADVSHSHPWQVSAHVLLAYSRSPDTYSELSNFNTEGLPVLDSATVYGTLAEWFPAGVSTRALWGAVRVLCHVVENTLRRLGVVREEYGNILDLYTKNVGLMLASQVDQVVEMFVGRRREEMFIAFPQVTEHWVRGIRQIRTQ